MRYQRPDPADAQEGKSTRGKSTPRAVSHVIENRRRQGKPTDNGADLVGGIPEHAHQHVRHSIGVSGILRLIEYFIAQGQAIG